MATCILGSGILYLAAWTNPEVFPADEVIEAVANKMGEIKGGAVICFRVLCEMLLLIGCYPQNMGRSS